MSLIAIVAAIRTVGGPALSAAQSNESGTWRRAYYDLERSHIDYPFGKGLIFEAQIAPQLIVAQSLNALFADGTVADDAEPHWAYSFSVCSVSCVVSDGTSSPM